MLKFSFRKKDEEEAVELPSGKVTLKLEMIGGWLYMDSPFGRVRLNDTALRYDGTPRNVLEYAILKRPGELITIDDLKKAGIATKRDLRQITANAGLRSLARDLFMPVCTRDKIKIIRRRRLEASLAIEVLENLR